MYALHRYKQVFYFHAFYLQRNMLFEKVLKYTANTVKGTGTRELYRVSSNWYYYREDNTANKGVRFVFHFHPDEHYYLGLAVQSIEKQKETDKH